MSLLNLTLLILAEKELLETAVYDTEAMYGEPLQNREGIDEAFIWRDTKQGHDFWDKIDREIVTYYDSAPVANPSEEETLLQQQTEQFWHLQLQFMNMDTAALQFLYRSFRMSQSCVTNALTDKMDYITSNYVTFKDHNCLATHLALQLSGLADV